MNNNPFISVVIPLYNKEENIKDTIQSVLNQTYDNYEIVVVNDGSNDKSATIVASIGDEKIRLFHQPNKGVSTTRNRGVHEAKYDYIAFLDGDDSWDVTYLEEMSRLIIDYPEATLFGVAYDTYVKSTFIPESIQNLPHNFRGIVTNYFELAEHHLLFWTSAVIVQKENFVRLGGFDERITMGEDLDMWFRIVLDFPIVFYNKVLAHYHLDAGNRAMKKKHDFTKSFLCYTQKYKTKEQTNPEFRSFINYFRCLKFIDLFINYNVTPQQIKEYAATINLKDIPIKWKIFIRLPYFLKKQIVKSYLIKKCMKTSRISMLIILFFTLPLISCLIDIDTHQEWSLINEDNWIMVWQEDFNHGINPNTWSYAVRGKAPWRRYMTEDKSCYEIRDNSLVLKGIKNTFLSNDTASYLTGGVWTMGKKTITYGRIEVRAKINKAQGAWPAIWMIGGELNEWPKGGEIDIVETANNENVIMQAIHTPYTINHGFTNYPINHSNSLINDKSEYNTYGLIINENELVFYINDRVTFIYPKIETETEGQFPFGNEKFLILSMQLNHAPMTKSMKDEDLPAEMQIDWVKFYHKIDKSLPDYNK